MSTQKRYPPELRERAVRLALESGRPISQVARDLGVGTASLRTWVRQAKRDAGDQAERLTAPATMRGAPVDARRCGARGWPRTPCSPSSTAGAGRPPLRTDGHLPASAGLITHSGLLTVDRD